MRAAGWLYFVPTAGIFLSLPCSLSSSLRLVCLLADSLLCFTSRRSKKKEEEKKQHAKTKKKYKKATKTKHPHATHLLLPPLPLPFHPHPHPPSPHKRYLKTIYKAFATKKPVEPIKKIGVQKKRRKATLKKRKRTNQKKKKTHTQPTTITNTATHLTTPAQLSGGGRKLERWKKKSKPQEVETKTQTHKTKQNKNKEQKNFPHHLAVVVVALPLKCHQTTTISPLLPGAPPPHPLPPLATSRSDSNSSPTHPPPPLQCPP